MKHHNYILILSGVSFFPININADALKMYTESWSYHNYLDESGKVSGASTDILKELGKRTNIDMTFALVPWARAYKSALKESNACVYTTSRTKERESQFQWVTPFAQTKWIMYKKLGNTKVNVSSLEDIQKSGLSVGVYRGDVKQQFLTKLGGFNLDISSQSIQSFQKLNTGRIDLWFASEGEASSHLTKYSDHKIDAVFTYKEDTGAGLACNLKIPSDMINKLNHELGNIAKSGLVKTITNYHRWKKTMINKE